MKKINADMFSQIFIQDCRKKGPQEGWFLYYKGTMIVQGYEETFNQAVDTCHKIVDDFVSGALDCCFSK